MEENKIVKLNIQVKEEETISEPTKKEDNCFQTNPILQKMHSCNTKAEKHKFKLKDLF